jgi:RNA polymerase sigma factor (sigma-70 family)
MAAKIPAFFVFVSGLRRGNFFAGSNNVCMILRPAVRREDSQSDPRSCSQDALTGRFNQSLSDNIFPPARSTRRGRYDKECFKVGMKDHVVVSESEEPKEEPGLVKIFLPKLNPQPDKAWAIYAELHDKLVNLFTWKRPGRDPLPLADQVIDRVCRHILEGRDIQQIASYCFGVARFIALEDSRKAKEDELDDTKRPLHKPPNIEETLTEEEQHAINKKCSKLCLQELNEHDREFIIKYSTENPPREQLAAELKITDVAMRQRASRIRKKLKTCVEECKRKGKT